MGDMTARIAENLAGVRERIAHAAVASGRTAGAVKLVAVTKYADDAATRALVERGCQDLGESRPQSLWVRAEALGDLAVRWHMVGHLQRNKVRRTLPLVGLLHSVDSLRLIEAIEADAESLDLNVSGLLEVNVSGDASKHGFAPAEMEGVLAQLASLRRLKVRGLMCMAALEGDADRAAREFALLRTLRDRLESKCPENVSLSELSMGMSGDFEIAIREGATMVRVGSALFAGIEA